MGGWFKKFEALIWAATLAMASLVFVYTSFATKEYVDVKHAGVISMLQGMKDSLDKIDQRTYDLARERK